jgi:hypothetical protein
VDWVNVLHLTTKWGFSALRAALIKAIYPLASPADKIAFGRKYELDDWFSAAYKELLVCTEDLTAPEGHRLGIDTVIALAAGRMRNIHGMKGPDDLRVTLSELNAQLHPGLERKTGNDVHVPALSEQAQKLEDTNVSSTVKADQTISEWVHEARPT